ncbi:MAG TPA: macro domain-containing protein [Phycisphaerae bacterium]|nr:macro domain-containing protein [Phycisphaerae bacterium]
MVKVLIGDLFASKAQTLVNTVNCVGVMGKGVALGFKERFQDMFKDYLARCQRGDVKLGRPYLYRSLAHQWILNFPTKDHWRSVSRLQDIERGLAYLEGHYKSWGIASLAVPPLGCGQGQLEWRIVGPTLYRYLSQMDIPVELYAPYGTPHAELRPEFLEHEAAVAVPRAAAPDPHWVRPGWFAFVEILNRVEHEPYHWPVGRTTFQKIAYVVTQQGLPTNLHYQRGSFGPFAPELKRVITRLVNNGLICEQRLGTMFAVKVGPTFQDARRAYNEYLEQWEPTIEKVADLFMRLHTHQAEVVATVLYAATTLQEAEEGKPSEADVLGEVMRWKERRRPEFDEGEVAYTIRNLAALGWLDVRPSVELPVPQEATAEV